MIVFRRNRKAIAVGETRKPAPVCFPERTSPRRVPEWGFDIIISSAFFLCKCFSQIAETFLSPSPLFHVKRFPAPAATKEKQVPTNGVTPPPFLKGGTPPLRAGAAWGAFQKCGISATFLSGTRGKGVAFAVMESRSRRFGVFLLFVLVRRAVFRFKERQHRGQSGKQSVPAQIPPPIVSAVSCAAMSPWRTNGLNEPLLPYRCFSKEPVPQHNSKNLRKRACHPDRLVQKSPQRFSFYKTLRIL